jgi:ATP-dependent Clp protease ATP-binding subunit ClpA
MVSVEQWILKCLQEPQTDLVSILRRHQVDSLRVQSHLRAILPACLPNASHYLDLPFAMTPEFLQILQRAWVLASNTNSTHICSGHIFAALYDFTVVRDRLFTNHSELGKMSPCNLILKEIKEMCPNSVESGANVSCDSMLLIE